MNHLQRTALIAALLGAVTPALFADVKLPAIFGDHMVLQGGKTLPIWGSANSNEAVTVTIGAETGHATADGSGNWRVDLPPLPPSATPVTVTVAGKNTVTLSDVLIGDVWICSGQSNMEYGIAHEARNTAMLAAANDPQIRLFMVPHQTSIAPQTDLGPPNAPLEGKWQVCAADTLIGKWGWAGFSAVGYYFAKNLHATTGQPVGMIQTTWGGTAAQSWTSLTALQKDPQFQHYIDAYQKVVPGYAQAKAQYPARLAAFKIALAAWEAKGGKEYEAALQKWSVQNAVALNAKLPPPPKPVAPPGQPFAPSDPAGGPHTPTVLFNGMVAPLAPFLIKGVIWYQGESNAGQAIEYRTLFPTMITNWRETWGQGDFPFIFVQLASFQAPPGQQYDLLREAQAKTLALPNTGMATALDLGEPKNIHPGDKADVGQRLALVARRVAYGENLVAGGPVFASMTVAGNTATLSFTQEGGGLVIGQSPVRPNGAAPQPSDHLVGFMIAGDDKNFVAADARIDGANVIVSSPQVPAPVAVRYDWANAPDPLGNLYNQEGLPAFPFRTDDWDVPVAPAAK